VVRADAYRQYRRQVSFERNPHESQFLVYLAGGKAEETQSLIRTGWVSNKALDWFVANGYLTDRGGGKLSLSDAPLGQAVKKSFMESVGAIGGRSARVAKEIELPSDAAMLGAANGGIDFNTGMLDLEAQGGQINFTIDNSMLQNLQPDSVHGIRPVIINITPVLDYIPLLGLTDNSELEA
ncbi:MAG TPA: hypothetical protein VLJ10_00740, partial [Candidatus Bathyarchaeia archaeon]|nr:hypothetical protein [Candidatus Bathyarchaeia archaeon]